MEHPEVTDFIAYLHLKNLAPSTVESYRQVLKNLFDHIDLGPSPPSQITAAQLRAYVASLSVTRSKGDKVSGGKD